jgi:hypothetical protein
MKSRSGALRTVVGVDSSPTGDLALGWTVDESTRRALPLHIIARFP